MFALTGTSPRRFSLRVGVTVTVSKSVAILRTTFTSLEGADRFSPFGKSARADDHREVAFRDLGQRERTIRARHGLLLQTARPSTLTDAPETAPLASSRTIPDTADWAAAPVARARANSENHKGLPCPLPYYPAGPIGRGCPVTFQPTTAMRSDVAQKIRAAPHTVQHQQDPEERVKTGLVYSGARG